MSSAWKHALVIGASSGIGEALARQLAHEGCQVALVARRADELARIANDLNRADAIADATLVRTYPHDVSAYACVPGLFQQITHDLGGLDLVIYAAGVMPPSPEGEYAFDKDRLTFEVNTLGAFAWLNEAAQRFERARAGTLVGISSVAGDRGRRGSPAYGPAYGASKAALNTYLESLRNRIGRFGVAVVTVKPGPVATPMTQHLDKLPFLIPAEKAAQLILAAARRRANTVYVPGLWRPIMFILRHIPSSLFKKINI